MSTPNAYEYLQMNGYTSPELECLEAQGLIEVEAEDCHFAREASFEKEVFLTAQL
jgi:hypothetical protein